MPDWKKIKAEYIRGQTSYRKLAEKYGVSFSSIKRKGKEEKWTDLRTQSEHKATSKIIEAVASQEATKAVNIDSVADALLEKIIEGMADGRYTVNAQSLKQLTGALKDIKDIKGIKSEADMREQEARIEKLRKECQTEKTDSDIRITISDELKQYSE